VNHSEETGRTSKNTSNIFNIWQKTLNIFFDIHGRSQDLERLHLHVCFSSV